MYSNQNLPRNGARITNISTKVFPAEKMIVAEQGAFDTITSEELSAVEVIVNQCLTFGTTAWEFVIAHRYGEGTSDGIG